LLSDIGVWHKTPRLESRGLWSSFPSRFIFRTYFYRYLSPVFKFLHPLHMKLRLRLPQAQRVMIPLH